MHCKNVFKVILFKFLVFEHGGEKNHLMLIEGNLTSVLRASPLSIWLVAVKSTMPNHI